jgi:hypothetical protein
MRIIFLLLTLFIFSFGSETKIFYINGIDTNGKIDCGGKTKDINITNYAINHFGKLILTKRQNGYDCSFQ